MAGIGQHFRAECGEQLRRAKTDLAASYDANGFSRDLFPGQPRPGQPGSGRFVAFAEFAQQFPDEASALGIETDGDRDPSGSGDNQNGGNGGQDTDNGNADNDGDSSDKNNQDSGVKKDGGVSSPFLWIIIVIAFLILVGAGCYYFLVYRKPGTGDKSKKPNKKVNVRRKSGRQDRKP